MSLFMVFVQDYLTLLELPTLILSSLKSVFKNQTYKLVLSQPQRTRPLLAWRKHGICIEKCPKRPWGHFFGFQYWFSSTSCEFWDPQDLLPSTSTFFLRYKQKRPPKHARFDKLRLQEHLWRHMYLLVLQGRLVKHNDLDPLPLESFQAKNYLTNLVWSSLEETLGELWQENL